jgi:hypothetical protein
MAVRKIRWFVKAQVGVLLLPAGLCLFAEAITRRIHQADGYVSGPWVWYGILSLVAIVAGVGLMVESGLLRGYPGQQPPR